MLCVLLVLTGCQKRQEQTDIRLPESDSAVTEETITEPTEKAEEALSEESHAEQEPQSTVPDLGDYENLCAVLQTLQTLDDWKSSPEYEIITAQKEKVLSQLIGSFYCGLDSLSLQNTAWGDHDLSCMAFEVFRSLLGPEDLELEAETPLEWFRTWFIWAFGHIHEADAAGLQAQYPASFAAIDTVMDHHGTWEDAVDNGLCSLDKGSHYDFDLIAARDQIVSYIRENEEIWPFSYTLILRLNNAPYGTEEPTPGDPNVYVDFIWWAAYTASDERTEVLVQELTLNPETGESSVWTITREDLGEDLSFLPVWVVDTLFEETFSLEQQNEVATLNDWDTSANNRVKIFNSTFAYPNQKTLIIYQNATANSDRLMTCSAGEALLFTGTSVTVGDYAWDEVRGWKQSGSSVSLVKGWYLRSNTEDCLPIYSTGVHIANYCADASFDSTHKRVAFTLLASAKLYNSSGTVIKTLSKGDEVCFTIDDGYAGATRPYLISICGYTVFTNNLGYYTAVTSTTFVDLNFDCGYTSGYRVVTEIDWS